MPQAPRITPAVLYDNRDELLKVYPELKPTIDRVHAQIEAEGCKGCARNKYLRDILTDFMALKPDRLRLFRLKSFLSDEAIRTANPGGVLTPPTDAPATLPAPVEAECPHCVQKHLCTCAILLNEVLNGYKHHLAYAESHYNEAVREGYAGPRLKITEEDAVVSIEKIWKYLELDKDLGRVIGLLGTAGELATDIRMKNLLRVTRARLQTIAPPGDTPRNQPEARTKPTWPDKLILHTHLSPGDIVMATALVRDIHKATGGKTKVAMDTTCREFWDNNPKVDQRLLSDKTAKTVKLNYTDAIGKCNQLPFHFIHGYRQTLEKELGLDIPCTGTTGEIVLSGMEKLWGTRMQELIGDPQPYWLLMAGGKSDFTTKLWPREYWLEVIEAMKDRITLVQVGRRTKGNVSLKHYQPKLPHVIDLIGKTDLRELCRLVYHSAGATCGITSLMHLAAAIPPDPKTGYQQRPCVVVAGGREPAHWEMYQHHAFLHNCGQYSCNRQGGCWKARTYKLGDGNAKKNGSLCEQPVKVGSDRYPRCMADIKPEQVIEVMNRYLDTWKNPYA